MIVICTRCQAKFKVADEKVGPRGAKVRCSRCQNVFLVHRELGTMPMPVDAPAAAPPRPRAVPDVELETASAGRVAPDDPFAAARAPSAPAPAGAPVDPFGPAGLHNPFAPPSGAPDPFAAPARDPFAAPAADPFAPASSPAPAASDDPFAAVGDPFAAVVTPRTEPARAADLPVTDLSALLGRAPEAADPPLRPPVPPAPAPAPAVGLEIVERTPPPAAAPAASGPIDFSGDFDFGPEPAAAAPPPDPRGGPGADLALEDRTTPGPARGLRAAADDLPAPDDPLPAPDPAPESAEIGFADPSEVSFYSGDDAGALALATEPASASAPSPVAAARPAPAAPVPRGAAPVAGAREDAAELEDAAAAGLARIPGGRGARLRTVAVNAVALAALLVVALAFRVVWRGEGSVGAGALRPSAVLGALARNGAPVVPLAAEGVTSGLYDRAQAPPVLFVRGDLVSHAAAPVGAVTMDVEIVRDGKVIARGAALAGAVPTAEELYATGDASALDALSERLRARAPRSIRPGERVPFLVAIGDVPAELAGASVRVAATAGAGATR